MTPDLQTRPEPGLTTLVSGIVSDVQELIQQQLAMFQAEIKTDLGRAKDAAASLGMGLAVSLLAGVFLCLTAAHFLVWMWPQLPLFAAHGIVAVVLLAIGIGLLLFGKAKLEKFHALPEKSVQALKENIQWTAKT